eukprot:TRINITY_DN352_c0_g1_i1.p3 TRINITY_DN352_c0_g1~~TRINITY_DN352_c0_g1_i1.p3  ORF type:complete len:101 (-),score=2.41 TRINITY_DN352_c0_g1_i1:30-332(-)
MELIYVVAKIVLRIRHSRLQHPQNVFCYLTLTKLQLQQGLRNVHALHKPGNPMYSALILSLIHISEPTRLGMISYAVFCLKKKKKNNNKQKYIYQTTNTT